MCEKDEKKTNKKNICTRHAVHCSTVTTIHYLGGRREGTHAAVFHTTTGESPRPKCLWYFQNIPWVPCVCTRIAALETRNFKCRACMSVICVYVRAPSSVELSGWRGERMERNYLSISSPGHESQRVWFIRTAAAASVPSA